MPPATSRAEPFGIKTKWTSDKPLELVAKGMKVPAGLTPITTNVSYLFGQLTRNRVNSAVCQPGRVVQEVSVQLPEGIAPKELPKPIHPSTADFQFPPAMSRPRQTLLQP